MKDKTTVLIYRAGIPTGSDTKYSMKQTNPCTSDEINKLGLELVQQYYNVSFRLIREIERTVDNYTGPQDTLTHMIQAILREKGRRNQVH